MSRRYAKAAVDALKADAVIAAWATGGILDRDPRRSGPNATGSTFATTDDRSILPTIAVVSAMSTRPMTRVPGANADGIEVRLFAPDIVASYDGLDATAERIVRLLEGYRSTNEAPGIFRYAYRMGMQNGGPFEGVAYIEIAFDVMSVYAPLEVM